MEKLTLDGAAVAYEAAGSGPPVILLHAGVADRRMWQSQMIVLGKHFRTIAYDRRGFGATETADRPFSHVNDLRMLLDALRLEQVALIGCSQGGRVAIDFILAYPQRVSRLALIASAVSGQPPPGELTPEVAAIDAAIDAADEAGDLARLNELEARLWLDGPLAEAGRVAGPLRDLFLDMNGIALRAPELTQEIEPPPAFDRLRELDLPVLVIWGELDAPFAQARCRTLAARVPGARTVLVPAAAHLPSLEKPDFVNAVLLAFLRQPGKIPTRSNNSLPVVNG